MAALPDTGRRDGEAPGTAAGGPFLAAITPGPPPSTQRATRTLA